MKRLQIRENDMFYYIHSLIDFMMSSLDTTHVDILDVHVII